MDSGPVVSMIFRADSISYLRNMVSQDGKTQKNNKQRKTAQTQLRNRVGTISQQTQAKMMVAIGLGIRGEIRL